MDVRQLGSMALIIVVAAIIIGMGTSILTSLAQNQCDYTWITNTTYAATNSVGANPVTGANYGCCRTTLGASNNCTLWETADYAVNTSQQGITGLITFANWIPLIALVIVAAIVIGVIVKYLGGQSGSV